MVWFRNCRLARMSSGHYCLIRDLGPVKGGKGLRHHDVLLDLSWRGLVRFVKSMLRFSRTDKATPPLRRLVGTVVRDRARETR
jgi:hypothetical protein